MRYDVYILYHSPSKTISPMKGFVITAIKADGLRQMAFDNNSRNTYTDKGKAEQKLAEVIANNSKETIKELIGDRLRVTPVELYESGDSTRTVF